MHGLGPEPGTPVRRKLVEDEVEDLGERPGDVHATYAWSTKLAEATGWRAQVDLREGLERTIAWFRSRAE